MKSIFRNIYTLIFCAVPLFVYAQSEDVKNIHLEHTGTLENKFSDQEALRIKSIVITGNINEGDIAYLQKMAEHGALEEIDLSKASFAATKDPLLQDASEYFLPMLAALKSDDVEAMEAYEQALGHTKNPNSLPGFWTFYTHKTFFFMTGYMNGWDGKINEVVIKTKREDLLRSPQIRSWIGQMGYEYKWTRSDGDLVFYSPSTAVWCLLHFIPYNKSDFPGIHFSSEEYVVW